MTNKATEKKELGEAVLEKIAKDNLKMKPCCYFILKSWFWRLIAAMALFFSAVVFGIAAHVFFSSELDGAKKANLAEIITKFPFFLLLFGFLAVYAAFRLYRKSRICCRHEDWMLFFALSAVSFLIAAFFYQSGLGFYLYDSVDHIGIMKFFVP